MSFSVGEKVWLKTKRISNAAKEIVHGLCSRYLGPFLIIEKPSPTTYTLQDEKTGKSLGDWNVVDLKPYVTSQVLDSGSSSESDGSDSDINDEVVELIPLVPVVPPKPVPRTKLTRAKAARVGEKVKVLDSHEPAKNSLNERVVLQKDQSHEQDQELESDPLSDEESDASGPISKRTRSKIAKRQNRRK